MKCGQEGCSYDAAYRYTWPGRDEAFVCELCVGKVHAIVAALGMHLQIHEVEPDPRKMNYQELERRCESYRNALDTLRRGITDFDKSEMRWVRRIIDVTLGDPDDEDFAVAETSPLTKEQVQQLGRATKNVAQWSDDGATLGSIVEANDDRLKLLAIIDDLLSNANETPFWMAAHHDRVVEMAKLIGEHTCKLCGKEKLSFQVFCGGACSAKWEAGQRPSE